MVYLLYFVPNGNFTSQTKDSISHGERSISKNQKLPYAFCHVALRARRYLFILLGEGKHCPN